MTPVYVCGVRTRRGQPCPLPVPEPGRPCHVHDPDGTYAQQHPKHRARMLLVAHPDPDAIIRAWPRMRCGLCDQPIPTGEQIMPRPMHTGPPVYGHVPCVLDSLQLEEAPMPACP